MPVGSSSTKKAGITHPDTSMADPDNRVADLGTAIHAANHEADLDFLPELRHLVEQRLAAYIGLPEEHSTSLLHDGCPPRLREAMQYSLLAGGKRLRPILVLLATEACRGAMQAALPAACAVEMIHTYSLIHDDLPAMDDDDLRRGRPTNHKVFGEGLAILAGDALLTLAFQVLGQEIQPPACAARCCAELASAAGACYLVGGQVADLEIEERVRERRPVSDDPEDGAVRDSAAQGDSADLAELESIHRRKTGALIGVSLRLGAIIAQTDQAQLDVLDRFGQVLGLAFQITDDLLDVRGSEANLGKRVHKDSQRGKLTYPGVLGVEESMRRAGVLTAEAVALAASLGPGARRLEALARFVLERDR